MMTICWIVLVVATTTVSAQLKGAEHAALVAVYNALECANEFCPSFGAQAVCPPSSGLECVGSSVTRIAVEETDVSGTIATQIGLLTNLRILNLSANRLRGIVPSHIGKLTNLEHLYFGGNFLTGSLPSEIYLLTKLQSLWVLANSFQGTISSAIRQLSLLTSMDFRENEFVGTIPSQIGTLTSLSRLYLQFNILEGSLPNTISRMIRLTILRVNQNLLSGTIPPLPSTITVTNCVLQDRNDTNCITCSGSVCACFDRACPPQTAPTTTTTTTRPPVTGVTSLTTKRRDDWSDSASPPPTSDPNPDSPVSSVPASDSNMASDESSDVSASSSAMEGGSKSGEEVPVALIAGIAGGLVGVALILGAVVLIMYRMRLNSNRKLLRTDAGSNISMSESTQASYSDVQDVRRPPGSIDSVDSMQRYNGAFPSTTTQARF